MMCETHLDTFRLARTGELYTQVTLATVHAHFHEIRRLSSRLLKKSSEPETDQTDTRPSLSRQSTLDKTPLSKRPTIQLEEEESSSQRPSQETHHDTYDADKTPLAPTRCLSKKLSSASRNNSLISKPILTGRAPSLTAHASKKSVAKKTSVAEGTIKKKTNEEILWYRRGAYVTVRNNEGGWFLCKLQHNVYNTTKSAKIRWLTRIRGRSIAIPFKSEFKLDYHDEIDPACILYDVRVTRKGSMYTLCYEDKAETEKLLKVIADVASGKLTSDELDSDVEEVVQIEPPVKKRRTMKTKKRDKTSGSKVDVKKKKNSKKQQLLVLYPNPDVKVWKKDLFFETNRSVPFVSKYAHSRLVFRAVHTKDYDLLRKLCKETEKVINLESWRSVADQTTALHHAITLMDKEAITLLVGDIFRGREENTDVYKKRADTPGDKVHMTVLDTGKYVSGEKHTAFPPPANSGKIIPSRLSTAWKTDVKDMTKYKYMDRWDFVSHMMTTGLDCETLKLVYTTFTNEEPVFSKFYHVTSGLDLSLERGHYRTAGEFMKKIVTSLPRSRRITPLHYRVLLSEELETIPLKQINKGIKLAGMITPLHCAACNPDTRPLQKLLEMETDVHLSDRQNRRLIHFAAGCEGTGPLELLVKRGANIFDCDHQGNTPLHFAARANRVNNAQILLDAAAKVDPDSDPCLGKYGVGGINRPNRNSYTPLHLAVENNSFDVVKLLVENEANMEATLNTNSFKLTPLMLAAQFGFFDIAVFLVKSGAVVQYRDRLGRTPVIHAAMNGNTNVLSYLLKIGANPNLCDTSDNSPLHYAAAYGWYFCVKTLLEAGADVDVTNNWKTTPLSVAYSKGHVGIVNMLLTDTDADINFQDDKGMTLVSIAATCYLWPDLYDQMLFLVKDSRALCTFKDIEDCTPLHHLARNNILLVGSKYNEKFPSSEAMNTSVKIAKLMIKHGCDCKAVDKKGMTAAMAAMRTGNVNLFKYLVQAGCPVLTDLDQNGDNILHHLCYDHMDTLKNYVAILKFAAKMDGNSGTQNLKKDFCAMAQVYCHHGTTPLLAACQQYRVYQRTVFTSWVTETVEGKRLRWKHGRDLIQLLIDEFDSNVNAFVREMHYENVGDKPGNERDRYQKGLAKWSVTQILADVKNCEYGGYCQSPIWPALRLILKYKPNVNTRDLHGHTPLTRALSDKNVTVAQLLVKESNANINDYYIKDSGGGTQKTWTMMMAVMSGKTVLFDLLVGAGADLTGTSETTGNKLLHSVIVHGDRAEGTVKMMQTLLDHGADVNVVNKEKKTPLHLAVNFSDGKIDDIYDVILFLLEKGADLTIRDVEGRIPLHYVFLKIRRSHRRCHNKHHHDPVELCRMVASKMTTEELNIQDNSGMTALHRAAFRGANICCLYLIQRGASVNVKDNNGNTALGLAVQETHDLCSTILIQNGTSLRDPVVYPNDEQTVDQSPCWKWAPLCSEGGKDNDKKISLFECAIRTGLEGVCFLMMEKPAGESGVTFGDAIEIGLKLQQYNIVLRLLNTTADVTPLHRDREHGRNLLHVLSLTATSFDTVLETVVTELVERGVSLTKQDDYKCTPLLYASLSRNYKLCTFYMNRGYNPKYKDAFHRGVLSAAFWKTPISYNADLTSWISEVHERKASLNELIDRPVHEGLFGALANEINPAYWRKYDCVKISPLIFAIHNLNQFFTQWILKKGASVNQADSAGRTPLMHAVRQNDLGLVKTLMDFEFDPKAEGVETKPADASKKGTSDRRFQLKRKASQMTGDGDESNSDVEEEMGDEDEDKKKPLKPYKKVSNVNLYATDKNGWSVIHHAACPLSFGTFDNDEIVFILAKAGAKLNVKNKKGETPLDLALKKGAPRIARMIQELECVSQMDRGEPEYSPVRVSDNMTWTNTPPSFHEDAERLRERVGKPMDIENEYEARIDSNCDIRNGTLVQDEDQDRLYDVLLTKVDLDVRVSWFVYNFYQMQLIYQKGKILYVLFTRWGRIGDRGQYQYTPYKVKDEAVKEFCKIFREKTGNKWTDAKSFENITCKYRLVHNMERRKQLKPTVIEFESKSTVKSTLPSHLQNVLKEMTSVKNIGLSLTNLYELDAEILPFGSLQRDQLLKARALLEEVSVKTEEVSQYRERRKEKSEEEESRLEEKYQQNLEQIEILSSEYYQVIPQRNFVYEEIRPLDHMMRLQQQIKLVNDLLDYEVTNSMLLGAKYREKEVNPLDYVYQSLGCQMQLMAEEDVESQYILKYIYSSARNRVEAIYRLEVEGEKSRMDKNKLGNHMLLWHGSGVANFISILHRGLVVAPLDAPSTGHLFGKGIYFSDSFCKSSEYCYHNNSDTKTRFMLLCEVALGRSKLITNKLKEPVTGYDSLFVLGRHRPQEQHNVRLPTGCIMPLGELRTEDRYKGEYISHGCSEYIVFDESQVCLRYLVQYK